MTSSVSARRSSRIQAPAAGERPLDHGVVSCDRVPAAVAEDRVAAVQAAVDAASDLEPVVLRLAPRPDRPDPAGAADDVVGAVVAVDRVAGEVRARRLGVRGRIPGSARCPAVGVALEQVLAGAAVDAVVAALAVTCRRRRRRRACRCRSCPPAPPRRWCRRRGARSVRSTAPLNEFDPRAGRSAFGRSRVSSDEPSASCRRRWRRSRAPRRSGRRRLAARRPRHSPARVGRGRCRRSGRPGRRRPDRVPACVAEDQVVVPFPLDVVGRRPA